MTLGTISLATPAERGEFFGLLREAERRRAKADLFYLCNYILGAHRIGEKKSRMDWHHEQLCSDLMHYWRTRTDRPTKTTVSVQWPRGSLKSSICTIGFPIWVLLNDPETRILIESETATNAQRSLLQIKSIVESRYFKFLFGQIYDPKHRWNTENLTIRREIEFKEPSIDVGGVEVEKTGNHYDLIIPDDVQGKTNSQTRDQIDKVINHVQSGYSLLNPQGMYLMPMTRWAWGDLGGYLEEQNEKARKEFREEPVILSKYTCWKHDINGRELTGQPEFPTLLPVEELADVRAKQGEFLFSCNYLLKPTSDETAIFKDGWLRFDALGAGDLNGAPIYITVDPAGGGTFDGADYTAIVVAAIDHRFDIHVLEVIRAHMTDYQLAEKLFALCDLYRPEAVGMEDVFLQKELFLWLRKKAEQDKKVLPLRRLTTSNKSKPYRIRGLQGPMEAGKVRLRPEMTYLVDEILRYPRGKHDDCVDALAYQLEFMHLPSEKQPTAAWETDPNWRKNWAQPVPAPSALDVKIARWTKSKLEPGRKMRFLSQVA